MSTLITLEGNPKNWFEKYFVEQPAFWVVKPVSPDGKAFPFINMSGKIFAKALKRLLLKYDVVQISGFFDQRFEIEIDENSSLFFDHPAIKLTLESRINANVSSSVSYYKQTIRQHGRDENEFVIQLSGCRISLILPSTINRDALKKFRENIVGRKLTDWEIRNLREFPLRSRYQYKSSSKKFQLRDNHAIARTFLI